jgi:hypothetical protein
VFKPWTNTGLPKAVRVVGELLEGAAKPVGSDAVGVIQLQDQQLLATEVVNLALKATRRSATAKDKIRAAMTLRTEASSPCAASCKSCWGVVFCGGVSGRYSDHDKAWTGQRVVPRGER